MTQGVATADVRKDAKAAAHGEREAVRQARRREREQGAQARREAKEAKFRERAEAREARRAEVERARAAARVDQQLTEQHAPEVMVVDEPAPRRETARPAGETARAQARRERAEVKEATRREREARRAATRDHIVEAPREPRKGLLERLRRERGRDGGTAGRRAVSLLAGAVGAVGLLCSFVLAVGALLVALGAGEGSSAYDTVTSVCDLLIGPLRDVFSFSGKDAEVKESLVAWGAGSMAYLVIGVLAQSLLRARLQD
ncbi:hypothetical protein GEV29_09570 [Aeromicrobium sp. SMF47]|uniref:hypothetical protein n=1 Tax=Aeromicrobium yanjiei TaxID=2662028 RepID=UPI00129D9304|nr:hypothetical protein [Aeromicrobium yanjiei]MRJ76784.1 hypothetical protein [Aeromicrobium yanjiei]